MPTEAVLPLTGIKVLELSAYISGPYCGALLAALGAEVVKLEPPKSGDPFRRGGDNRDAYFLQYNAGKRSIAVDLKTAEGIALVRKLLPRFDVVIENSRPGKMAALGLGPEDCRSVNPELIYASVSGFGNGGPLRDRPAYDSIGQSISGFYSLMMDQGESKLAGGATADLITGLIATLSILSGLVGRGRTGAGAVVQTSLYEAMSSLTIDAISNYYEQGHSPHRRSRHAQAQAYCVTAADGRAITLHMSVSEKFWTSLARVIDRPDLLEDSRFLTYRDRLRNYNDLQPILDQEFSRLPRDQWENRLLAEDVPFAPVQSIGDVVAHPQTEWLELLEAPSNGIALVRPPFTYNGARPRRDFDAPQVGEHTREILGEVLPPDEIERLIAAGVLRAGEIS